MKTGGHENVVKLLAFGSDKAQMYVLLELVGGNVHKSHLLDLIQRNEGLSENVASKIFRGIAKGLEFIHDNEICHLDLSPENVLLEGDMEVPHMLVPKIIDFGLARIQDRTIRKKRQAGSFTSGKTEYMAQRRFYLTHPSTAIRRIYSPLVSTCILCSLAFICTVVQ